LKVLACWKPRAFRYHWGDEELDDHHLGWTSLCQMNLY
jgi:hypothetical protein